jgi:hypothetical protein
MPSKLQVLRANNEMWQELQEWKLGHVTLADRHARLGNANVPRVIVADTWEGRQEEAPQLTMVQIKADTDALYSELFKWKNGLRTFTQRARSRSPRRAEIVADSTSSRRAEALGFVAAHAVIRSEAETRMKAMIDERDATIAKQAKIITDLEAGKGLIGSVLKEAFPPSSMDDNFWRDRMERPEMKVSVMAYIKETSTMASNLSSRIMFNTQY